MATAAHAALTVRLPVIADRAPSAWTRTVAVIRIPRFTRPRAARRDALALLDPLAAFADEADVRRLRRAGR